MNINSSTFKNIKFIISILSLTTVVLLYADAIDRDSIVFSRAFDQPNANSERMVLKIDDEHSRVVYVDRNNALDYRDIAKVSLAEGRGNSLFVEIIFT